MCQTESSGTGKRIFEPTHYHKNDRVPRQARGKHKEQLTNSVVRRRSDGHGNGLPVPGKAVASVEDTLLITKAVAPHESLLPASEDGDPSRPRARGLFKHRTKTDDRAYGGGGGDAAAAAAVSEPPAPHNPPAALLDTTTFSSVRGFSYQPYFPKTGGTGAGKKTHHLLRRSVLETIVLPRQARDKHRKR